VHTHRQHDEQAGDRRSAAQPHAPDQLRVLQAQAGNAAVARLLAPPPVAVQRYQERYFDRARYKVTDGGQYAIRTSGDPDARAAVWVRDGVAAPQFLRPVPNAPVVTLAKQAYHEHVPLFAPLQDCLHAAEEIINGRQLQENGVHSMVPSINRPFGVGDRENVEAATAAGGVQGAAVDIHADPGVGQAFVVVNLRLAAGSYPYHAAAVVAADGNDRITLEQTRQVADNQTPSRTFGETQIYTVGGARSFHTKMQEMYPDGRTIVIARPPGLLERVRRILMAMLQPFWRT
jgi:hypothetical protein